jgi:hypothetical protein
MNEKAGAGENVMTKNGGKCIKTSFTIYIMYALLLGRQDPGGEAWQGL